MDAPWIRWDPAKGEETLRVEIENSVKDEAARRSLVGAGRAILDVAEIARFHSVREGKARQDWSVLSRVLGSVGVIAGSLGASVLARDLPGNWRYLGAGASFVAGVASGLLGFLHPDEESRSLRRKSRAYEYLWGSAIRYLDVLATQDVANVASARMGFELDLKGIQSLDGDDPITKPGQSV
jgi:hypothetical protein